MPPLTDFHASPESDPPTLRDWTIAPDCWQTGDSPRLMGILNVTPDSFSDGGRFVSFDAAVAQGVELVRQGADILDVGGESTRPYSQPVPLQEELARVLPVIEALSKQVNVPISIDTSKSEVARAALQAGASIINDVSGLTLDPEMPRVCAEIGAAVIVMHMQGTPATMQAAPRYADVVDDIRRYLEQRLVELEAAGIPRERVVLDPGIGFGKTAQHNLQILSSIARFRDLGRPVCIGHSRKGFLKSILGRPVDERSSGTIGVSIALAEQHTDLLRVHDVAATRDALLAWRTVRAGTRTA